MLAYLDFLVEVLYPLLVTAVAVSHYFYLTVSVKVSTINFRYTDVYMF